MKYIKSTPIKPSLRPLDGNDLEIAIGALFGTPADRAWELTSEQKAKQDAALRPYMEIALRSYSPVRDATDVRSEAARAARLKVLARKRAEVSS